MERIEQVRVIMTIDEDLLNKINEFMKNNKDVYSSRSHFLRCSALYLMKNKKEGVL